MPHPAEAATSTGGVEPPLMRSSSRRSQSRCGLPHTSTASARKGVAPPGTGSVGVTSALLPKVLPAELLHERGVGVVESDLVGREVAVRQVGEKVVDELRDERGQHRDALPDRGGRQPDVLSSSSPQVSHARSRATPAPIHWKVASAVAGGTGGLGDRESDLVVVLPAFDEPGHEDRGRLGGRFDGRRRHRDGAFGDPLPQAGDEGLGDGQDPAVGPPGAHRVQMRGQLFPGGVPVQAAGAGRTDIEVRAQLEGPGRGRARRDWAEDLAAPGDDLVGVGSVTATSGSCHPGTSQLPSTCASSRAWALSPWGWLGSGRSLARNARTAAPGSIVAPSGTRSRRGGWSAGSHRGGPGARSPGPGRRC